MADKEELACTYAALILHDAGKPVTAASINSAVTAAGLKVQGFWPNLFEKVLATRSLDDIINKVGVGSGAPAAAAPAATTAAPAASKPAVEAKPVEEEEDAGVDFDLFG
eukprot:TRINITY_DN1113_c0_g1_i1.p1 TRINITY_DN1113_c0_g1~~TRINITY_DN1113_c0_g1_i1.p1  ORF type:complete len:124 (-),score=51.00 TRINITY_DN1113_c0_g1_i1:48-374(-)